MGKRWVPLESNPDVLNAFAKKIGAPAEQYAFCDVLGMDEVRAPDLPAVHRSARLKTAPPARPAQRATFCHRCCVQELLMMIPQPVEAVLMLFPITDATEKAKAEEEERLKKDGQDVSPSVWFSKQTISNACGTVGMLHAYANSPRIKPADGSFLQRFLAQSQSMSPEERARFLEQPQEGEPDIEEAHQDAAQGGQTAPPPEDEQVRLLVSCRCGVLASSRSCSAYLPS